MFKTITSQFALLAVGLIACTTATIAFVQYQSARTAEETYEIERLDFAVRQVGAYLGDIVDQSGRMALFLADTPPIQGILRARANHGTDPLDGSSETIWKSRLAQIFEAIVKNNADLIHVRFIGAEDGGRELVRVNRDGETPGRVPTANLQQKGNAAYFEKTLKAPPGAVITHDINLNREYGAIETPHRPVLRVSTPVYGSDGAAAGIIIVNIHMQPVLDRLARQLPPGETLLLTNAGGDYLIHPDQARTFGFDLGRPQLLQRDYEAFGPFVSDQAKARQSTTVENDSGRQIAHLAKIRIDPSDPRRYLVAVALLPESKLLEGIRAIRDRTILVAGVLAVIGVLLALALSQLLTRPLQRLRTAAQKLAAGSPLDDANLPFGRRDEVGGLARSFYVMAMKLEERQNSLEEKEARIGAILETAGSPIITIDDRGLIQDANVATSSLLGYEKTDLIGSNVSMLMTSADRDRHDQYLMNYLDSGVRKIIGVGREVEARHQDGSTVPVHLAISEVRLKEKTVFTGIITDLTEQKKADRLKDEFVSTVSHELRTPLTSIKGALGLLRSSVLGELPDDAQSMINIAHGNCDRLVRLINDILDIEKIEAGKLAFTPQWVELAPFLKRTVEANQAFAEEFGVRLEIIGAPSDLQVEADPDRLAQVMTNLLSNAAKFSPKGQVVSVAAERRGEGVRLSVSDRGPGIPESFKDKLFGKFLQADSSNTRAKGGTGLGLAITKAIVDAHGGTIAVETEDGQGTTFHVDLPIAQSVPAGAAAPIVADAPKVLICEDDPDMAALLHLLVGDMGYRADLCASAAEAKQRLAAGSYAAMTLDLGLPDQSGVSLIQELRDDPLRRDLPILVISADAETSQQALQSGAFSVIDWLDKPIDVERLQSGIARAAKPSDAAPVRILHIEDDDDHRTIISALVGQKATIDAARTCGEARQFLETRRYDLVILDLQLADGRGESLLPLIRNSGDHPPQVLILSVSDISDQLFSEVDKVIIKSQSTNDALKRQIDHLLKTATGNRGVDPQEPGRQSAA